ncbi:MAG: monovalent cation:proton antiporter-2 (CPA2) family protein [Polyangiales bacterium]
MHGQGFFFQAFVYLCAAVVAVPIAKRLGLGSVLGYLLAGMVIGPFALGLIGTEGEDVMHFAEFGVVMMLFLIGLELQPSLLWRMRGPILGLGGLQVVATAMAIMSIGLMLEVPWRPSLAIGMILALSSTAIVLQTLAEKRLLETDGGQGAFSVLLFQDIAVIPMLAVLPLLATQTTEPGASAHGTAWVDTLPAWGQTVAVLGAVVAIVFGGRYLIRPLFRFIAKTRLREIFTAAALLLVIGIALLMDQVGLSPALGTFLAGVVLAESEYRHELEADIEPFKGLLLGVFFIAVGASIDFALIAARPTLIAALVVALVAVKLIVLAGLGRVFRMGLDQNLLFSLSLAQGGEFAFVLFSYATQQGVVGAELTRPLVAAVAISMATTPLLMLLNEKLLQPRFGTRERVERPSDTIEEANRVIITGFGRVGGVVGRFLRANKVTATVLEFDSDHVELLRKIGIKVFYGDASRVDLLKAAGADTADVIVIAIDEHERVMELVRTCQEHFPNLAMIARARGRLQAYELLDAGVAHVYRETLDTSLRMGVDALRLLGFRAYRAQRAARMFRRHDEASLAELRKVRFDQQDYFSAVREQINYLEQTLLDDMDYDDGRSDAGWDSDSLRQDPDISKTDPTPP